MHVKRLIDNMQPDGSLNDDWQQLIRGPRDEKEALEMLKEAIVEINATPALLRWFYHARAIGADALLRLENNAVAQAVRAARAAQPVAPFDVIAAVDAPRPRMSTDHDYPVSIARMETYNVYLWLHHHYNLHEGLSPPFGLLTRRAGVQPYIGSSAMSDIAKADGYVRH